MTKYDNRTKVFTCRSPEKYWVGTIVYRPTINPNELMNEKYIKYTVLTKFPRKKLIKLLLPKLTFILRCTFFLQD